MTGTLTATPGSWRERLWKHIDVGWESECWEWTGMRIDSRGGYGRLYLGDGSGRYRSAHRLAYEYWYGPIGDESVIRHHCDNPPCCNPSHLDIGTQADNMRDAVVRNRVAVGQRHGLSKLSDEDVRNIRKRYVRHFEKNVNNVWRSNAYLLCREYGVSYSQIMRIASGAARAVEG